MPVKTKVIPKAVKDNKGGTATPQFLSGGDDNPPDYNVPEDNNEWQQNLDGPWFATADVELDNDGEASIPLKLFDDTVPEGNETIEWTISDSAPFGFKKTSYTFTEGDTTVDIPLSDGKKFKKNKTVTIEIEDNDTETEDGADTVDNDTSTEDAGVDTVDNDTSTEDAGVDTVDDDTSTEDAGVDTVDNDTGTEDAGVDTVDNDTGTEDAGVDTVDNDPLTGGAGGIDTTTDFTEQESDELLIAAREFSGGLIEGDLLAQQFIIGSGAANANQPFIYNSSTEEPFFDVDGGGSFGQTQIASLPISLSYFNP